MITSYMQYLMENREIPGAVVLVHAKGERKYFKAFGGYQARDGNSKKMTTSTWFDAASLTKVMATLPAALYLINQEKLNLHAPVQHYIPEFTFKPITIYHLLTHTAGLSADLSHKSRWHKRNVFHEVLASKLVTQPGDTVKYTDLGMILLGKVIERITAKPLNHLVETELYPPWNMPDTTYLLTEKKKAETASTEWDNGQFLQGEVHDEKAFQMGGVSGNAGLFTTAEDVEAYGLKWLYPGTQAVIAPSLLKGASQEHKQGRGLGWEVWNSKGPPPSCGEHWPEGSFGHTGFTGTSLWINPKDEIITVFLTNVVHYGRSHNLKTIRKELHSHVHQCFAK
ncbi:CubicO group peptidase, beta-lactamase class C family [Thalassobacillus cyri]|uniref:CubicO group peptidase, beta-lactamase class C family n=1 Tax=Thalassobacillus cyri TaxID=571932 RepID=A0A1H4D5I1_9BACI|nr:serine hydrolase domain-containing protein [Thalassobacillus cyri]SEA68083.1 CubicO group peptidase, beta-lactamase class C family [Thalassobacillus cyri]